MKQSSSARPRPSASTKYLPRVDAAFDTTIYLSVISSQDDQPSHARLLLRLEIRASDLLGDHRRFRIAFDLDGNLADLLNDVGLDFLNADQLGMAANPLAD